MAEDIFKTPGTTTTASTATPAVTKPADPLDHDKDGKKGGAAPAVASATAPVNAPEVVKPSEPAKEAPQASPAATAPATPATPAVAQPAAQQTATAQEPSEDEEDEEEVQQPSELDFLKKRADFMNIGYSSDADVETLKAKIKAKMEGTEDQPVAAAQTSETAPLPLGATEAPKQISLRQYMQQEKMKLVRLRITNMDPKKADLQGEIITVANEYLGTVRKFVPFGEFTDNGFHVPYCIYEMLQERRFLSIKTKKGNHGTTQVESQWVKEFALEVLPPLTPEELARLATDQRAAGGLAENAI